MMINVIIVCNRWMFVLLIFLLQTVNLCSADGDYDVPPATVEVFYPKGFRVSIPADPDIKLFAFHGKLNEEFDGLTSGHWATDITKVRDGRFTFNERMTSLKIGDTLYFWTYVIYKGLGYRQEDGVFKVEGYVNATVPISTPPTILNPTNRFTTPAEQTCQPSLTKVNNVHPCAGTLIFEDDFNFIDETKWTKLREFSGEPDHEFVVYIPNEDVLYTQNGFLHIEPKRLESEYGENAQLGSLDLGFKCTSKEGQMSDYCTRTSGSTIIPPVISSRLTTLNKFSFLYGRVEIRARLPSEDWVFPLLLLEPANNFYGAKNLASGQMRIAFVKGKDGLLSGGVLLGATEPTRSIKMCTNPNPINLNSDFHTFSLEWKLDEITLSIANQIYCRINPQQGFYTNFLSHGNFDNNFASLWQKEGKMAPFDKEFRLTVGIGVGGLNDFVDSDSSHHITPTKPWKNTQVKAMKLFWDAMKTRTDYPGNRSGLEVDYVRVYSL
ncbi:beta-1,3-glucan-binding protein-like [Bradysia coprophila]|uniref:beta-1,3-glucan-binding protein-like n=1 Tax=Bradysia coprophila TaxID=38358 RepID=UPI00187DB4D8|nr:beta-1,3-glucan-binding protein-like [Bradysia coprophila]